jgi:hypothetical protein
MNLRMLVFATTLLSASSGFATGTGPTLPEKSREHPLDSREPRQDVIEQPGDTQSQPRPPTLESPPAVAPPEPTERRLPTDSPPPRGPEADAESSSAS